MLNIYNYLTCKDTRFSENHKITIEVLCISQRTSWASKSGCGKRDEGLWENCRPFRVCPVDKITDGGGKSIAPQPSARVVPSILFAQLCQKITHYWISARYLIFAPRNRLKRGDNGAWLRNFEARWSLLEKMKISAPKIQDFRPLSLDFRPKKFNFI